MPEALVQSSEKYNWKISPYIMDDDENLPIAGLGASYQPLHVSMRIS